MDRSPPRPTSILQRNSSEFANIIAGFPKGIDDRRDFHTANSSSGNHFRLSLECVDAAGHGSATIELSDKEDTNQSALIRFTANAGDVDSFENALRVMSSTEEGVATLG
jgi:hypothetical protein